MLNKFCKNNFKGIFLRLSHVFFFKAECIHPGCFLLTDFIHFVFLYNPDFPGSVVKIRCHSTGMFLIPTQERDTRYTIIQA